MPDTIFFVLILFYFEKKEIFKSLRKSCLVRTTRNGCPVNSTLKKRDRKPSAFGFGGYTRLYFLCSWSLKGNLILVQLLQMSYQERNEFDASEFNILLILKNSSANTVTSAVRSSLVSKLQFVNPQQVQDAGTPVTLPLKI